MPDALPPSEFGGKIQRNGIMPPPHSPTAAEKLSLTYRTGDETGKTNDDRYAETFNGLLEEGKQRDLREAAGDLKKGEIWDEMVASAE